MGHAGGGFSAGGNWAAQVAQLNDGISTKLEVVPGSEYPQLRQSSTRRNLRWSLGISSENAGSQKRLLCPVRVIGDGELVQAGRSRALVGWDAVRRVCAAQQRIVHDDVFRSHKKQLLHENMRYVTDK